MNRSPAGRVAPAVLFVALLFVAGCAAGNARFDEAAPAGFFAGLWHGFILVIAFVISLFNDTVRVYEANNSGNLYNLGFVLGAAGIFGSGLKVQVRRRGRRRRKEDRDELEAKVKKAIRTWLDESEDEDSEWKEIAAQVEEKIKREIRNWAEKGD